MRPENIKLMSTVAVFFCDVAFRLEPDKGPLYVHLSLKIISHCLRMKQWTFGWELNDVFIDGIFRWLARVGVRGVDSIWIVN